MFDKRTYQRELMRRRRAAEKAAQPQPVEQHAAHVRAWVAGLPAMALLDFRAYVRRCVRDKAKEISWPS